MKKKLEPADWGLMIDSNGELSLNGVSAVSLARNFGTPLYVLNGSRLYETASRFKNETCRAYKGKTNIHYPFKCNSVPAVLEIIKQTRLNAEVMTEFELDLAVKMGFDSSQIIVNGPCKSDRFLASCIENDVKLVIVDSIDELNSLAQIAGEKGKSIGILLRINPDYIPKGMSTGTAMGSRKTSSFGLDLAGGEAHQAIKLLPRFPQLEFLGFQFHIGTGIRNPEDYSKTILKLKGIISFAQGEGLKVKIIDVGGGIASFTTRELLPFEMLKYQMFNLFPKSRLGSRRYAFRDFAEAISKSIYKIFKDSELPEIIFEPGRCLVSPNQFLLLKAYRIKERPGLGKWIISDGGLGTITLPTYYEYHEIFLCNKVCRKDLERVTITGPCCFAADLVYKNIILPRINQGEIIAIMDAGAYFNSMESSFGFPKPAIVEVKDEEAFLIRKRETFEEMTERDLTFINFMKE